MTDDNPLLDRRRTSHDLPALGAYALGVLDTDEVRSVNEHVAGCQHCQADLADLVAVRDALSEVPPEAFLDGPPEGGDLLLQRTLREIRAQTARSPHIARRPRRPLMIAAAIVVLAAVAVAGGLVGRQTAPALSARGEPAPTASVSPMPSGVRTLTGTDPSTGVSMTVSLTPAAGWVRLHVEVHGVPEGRRCQLLVTSRSTQQSVLAGSWMVSAAGAAAGTVLDGSALVAPADVGSVSVVTTAGEQLAAVNV